MFLAQRLKPCCFSNVAVVQAVSVRGREHADETICRGLEGSVGASQQ
jgi:hypothetical protein